jgi:hypothetical protein
MPVVLDDKTRLAAYAGPLLIAHANRATDPARSGTDAQDEEITFPQELRALDLSKVLLSNIRGSGFDLDVVALALTAVLNEIGEQMEQAHPYWTIRQALAARLPIGLPLPTAIRVYGIDPAWIQSVGIRLQGCGGGPDDSGS